MPDSLPGPAPGPSPNPSPLKPAANIIFGFFGGALAFALLRVADNYGYSPSPDIATALPGALALVLAHVWDVWTGGNKS